MKLLFFLLMTILIFSLHAFAGEKGHGGDPLRIYAEVYPDQLKLEEAIKIVEEKVMGSQVEDSFKSKVLKELRDLFAKKSFLYIESLLIVDADGIDRFPNDIRTFVSLGGMTDYQKGSLVYLSKRTLLYNEDQLARLLLHEVLHHMFRREVSKEEDLINAAVSMIWESLNNENVQSAIRTARNNCSLTAQEIHTISQDTIAAINTYLSEKLDENMSMNVAYKEGIRIGATLALSLTKVSRAHNGSGVGVYTAGEIRTVYQGIVVVLKSIDRKCTLN